MGIKPIPMMFNGVRYRSTLEADWAATFESLDMHYTYEPVALEIDGDTAYLPDFHLPTQNVWAEVKGPLNERIDKPRLLQAAFERGHRDEWAFTCPLVVLLRPAENGTSSWEGTNEQQDIVIVLCPNCQHFGFMDYDGPWRCRRYCKNKTNKFWNESGGGIWWPGEIPFVKAPRPARKAA